MTRIAGMIGCTGSGWWLPRVWFVAAILAWGSVAALAGEPSARSLVAEANRSMTVGDNAKSLELLQKAAELKPDSPEIAYDLGIAHYRAGDYAAAAEYFMKALAGRNVGIEQQARFNLGNCAYSEGLKEQKNPQAAIDKFKVAADRFREALQIDPRDGDARANLERSGLMIRHLKEQQEKQKQQQKQQQQQNPESQPSSQPESQPSPKPESRPESQPSSQPENQQQKQGEEKNEQQKESEEKKGEQKEGEKKEGKPQAAEQQKGEQEKEQQAQAVPATQKAMSKEEAEGLLQLIRDKERQRREAQYNEDQKGRSREAPVDKDW